LLALGRFGFQGGELGFNEPRHLNTLWQQLNSQKSPPKVQAGIFAQFSGISNNQGTWSFLTPLLLHLYRSSS
jgi:hypothetical protein